MHETQKAAAKIVQHLTKQSSSTLSKVAPKTVIRSFLLSEETYTTIFLLILVDRYGFDCFGWAPETIQMELEDDFQLKLPKSSLDKIMAAICLVTTNFFYKDVTKFIELCNILAGDDFQPEEFEPADAAEIMWGITESLLIWPPDEDGDTEFSPEIREYIKQIVKEEGIVKPFDVLQLAFSDEGAVNVDADYADDPEMYSAIYEMQQSKENDLKASLMENVLSLTGQLRLLPLADGKTSEVVNQLQEIVDRANVAL